MNNNSKLSILLISAGILISTVDSQAAPHQKSSFVIEELATSQAFKLDMVNGSCGNGGCTANGSC